MHPCLKTNAHVNAGFEWVGSSVRGRAAATGETLWSQLPCNPTLSALLSERALTALNCYL